MIKNLFFAVNSDDFDVPKGDLTSGSLQTVLQIVFAIAAGVALIVLILAGMKYVLSRGEPGEVAKAKNAIIYAVIGLAVCVSAFSIVTFVIKSVS